MAVENTRDGRRFDRSYLVFGRMAELSGRSIIIGHEAFLYPFINSSVYRDINRSLVNLANYGLVLFIGQIYNSQIKDKF